MDWIVPDELLARCTGIGARVTTRHAPAGGSAFHVGLSAADAPAIAALVRHGGLPSEPRMTRQVHGTRCLRVSGDDTAAGLAGLEADALYTDAPGIVIGVRHADCLPLLIARRDGGEVAAVHAGWRGLAAGVIEAALREFRGDPVDLVAWLGPAIGPDAFEVGDEVRAAFLAHAAAASSAFRPHGDGKWWCDLYSLARQRLAAQGVLDVHGGGDCTFRDAARFHSFRRDRTPLRMASLVWRS
jgi:hypothetical protein